LAQRRRRVFVVASARNGFDPAQVLFEWDGMRRDTAPSRQQGQDTAGTLASRTDGGGFPGTDEACSGYIPPVAKTLIAGGHSNNPLDETLLPTTAHTLQAEGFDASEDEPGRGAPLVPVAFDTTQITSAANRSNPKPGDACHPLAASSHAPAIAFDCKASGQNDFGIGEIAGTMRAMGHARSHKNGGGHQAVAVSLRGREGGQQPHALTSMQVRRLTPVECERLQGFPESYTAIPWRKKPASECPDGHRYKALGNSWAVPCARWIGQRIEKYILETAA
jgi:DNA (cytosine-5)-methyltransferase 1